MAVPPPLTVLSLPDVAPHKSKDDCWLVIHGKVYDVTSFLEEHPGGDDVLVEASGKDATTEFDEVGHSDHAKSMLKTYFVGVLEGFEADVAASDVAVDGEADQDDDMQAELESYAPQTNVTNQTSILATLFRYLIPLLMLGAAFAIRYFRGNEKDSST